MSNDITTLITTVSMRFDPRNSLHNLETVLTDPLLKSLFCASISGPLVSYRPQYSDAIPEFHHGRFGYRLHEHIANDVWTDLQRLAYIIHCAANNYNPFASQLPVSIDIPYAALDEISLEIPAVSLSLVYQNNPLSELLESRDRVVERAQAIKAIGFYFINWIAEAVRRSIKRGESTNWNFGAFWGMTKGEFIERARRGYIDGGGFDDLRDEVQCNQEKYDQTIAELVKGDSDALLLRLTDGHDHEIRVLDPNEPLIIVDLVEDLEGLDLDCDSDEGGKSDSVAATDGGSIFDDDAGSELISLLTL